ncbi:MAG: Do family serine endopeptidase [Bacteroidota bacterium]
MKNFALLLGVSLLSAVFAISGYRYLEEPEKVIIREPLPARLANFNAEPSVTSQLQSRLSTSPTNFTSAAEAVTPAVVNIRSSSSTDFDIWGGYGGSSGSGVIVSSDGYIVTNNHVIEDSKKIEVTLSDNRQREATIIGTDDNTDLALIKIKAEDLPYLAFGNSDSIRVGEWVLAVGNPFNLESTVTAGIVSAKGRSIDILEGEYKIESFIQTDAAVNPGNSGGALVNTRGELIGINTAIITRSGRYEGYSFAIPANLAAKVISDLRDFGIVQRGILGVGIDEVTDEKAQELGLETVEGVLISRITPGSGADDAGLRRDDVIVSVNGAPTRAIPELQEQVALYRPGNRVEVEYIRDGRKQMTSVLLKNKSNTTSLSGQREDEAILRDIGFELRNLSDREMRKTNVSGGVLVVSVFRGSKIESTNMDPDFIITKVNDVKVSTVEEVIRELKRTKGKVMLEGVYENYPGEYYYAFFMNE